jgi:hypothetical protein
VKGDSQRVRDVDAARLAIVHVASHSRQRHKVITVIVLASVSSRLPWQNGHAVGLLMVSFNRDSDMVGIFHPAFIELFALFTSAHLMRHGRGDYAVRPVRRGLERWR